MSQILLLIPDESPSTLHVPPPEAGDELRGLAAVKLFEMKRLSSGAAARMAGILRTLFLPRLGDCGVPAFEMSEDEFQRETRLV
ncbi:MAG: UPF0175 family protein [Candidatus Anammoximicrobium sp.]|nr:UPF0175 family protein [Candidatus Anammoximicrobium sp.]